MNVKIGKFCALAAILPMLILLCGCGRQNEHRLTARNGADQPFDFDSAPQEESTVYVLNTGSRKIHVASCTYAKRIKKENRREASSPEQALAQGYVFCRHCCEAQIENNTTNEDAS